MFVCGVFFFITCSNIILTPDVVMDAGDMVARKATEAALVYLEKKNGAKVAKKSMVEVEGSKAYITVDKGLNYHNSDIIYKFRF